MQYTLCFLKHQQEILLLNRNKAPWMGNWNGVGGKLENEETPLSCAIREIEEETGIRDSAYDICPSGKMEWIEENQQSGILHLFLAELHQKPTYSLPLATREGILDFKSLKWILDQSNTGVVDNLPYLVTHILKSAEPIYVRCYYEQQKLVKIESKNKHG
ncbi:NUDIX hydrolase [Listeria costaricensis]|uniref:NUDIX hydrolase n=1 Tax=Listeria costaricensis TaxID=2026604 RepID=UPI000C077900|nr:8-oxo-dGTP diphosphatase [Listeria costaricensis]